jgi:hypothetical protein
MLHSPQKWIKPSHVLSNAVSEKLPFNLHRLISSVFELGVVK